MTSSRTWSARIGGPSARLRSVYVTLWLTTIVIVLFAAVCAFTGFPPSQTAAIVVFAALLLAAVVLGSAQIVVGRKLQSRVTMYVRVTPDRRFPVRILLNKGDFDRWVATLPG